MARVVWHPNHIYQIAIDSPDLNNSLWWFHNSLEVFSVVRDIPASEILTAFAAALIVVTFPTTICWATIFCIWY